MSLETPSKYNLSPPGLASGDERPHRGSDNNDGQAQPHPAAAMNSELTTTTSLAPITEATHMHTHAQGLSTTFHSLPNAEQHAHAHSHQFSKDDIEKESVPPLPTLPSQTTTMRSGSLWADELPPPSLGLRSRSNSSANQHQRQKHHVAGESEHAAHASSASGSAPDDECGTKPEDGGYDYNPGDRRFVGRALRQHWYQFWRFRDPPLPPPPSMEDAGVTPYARAGWLSVLFYEWMTPMMVLGYRRPLESSDLWRMDSQHEAKTLSRRLNADWERRVREAEEKNRKIIDGTTQPGFATKAAWAVGIAKDRYLLRKVQAKGMTLARREQLWRAPPPPGSFDPPPPKAKGPPPAGAGAAASAVAAKKKETARRPRNYSGHHRPSLIMAIHDQFAWLLWTGLLIKLVGDVAQLTAPLVVRRIITYGQQAYAAAHDPMHTLPAPSVGLGVGLSFVLFAMTIIASVFQHQFFFRSMSVGVFSRAALISAIFERGLQMNGKDRAAGKLTNHISTDVSRIDFASNWFTLVVSAPIQIIICLVILLTQLGPSALAGFAILVLAAPVQTLAMGQMFKARRKSMVWTDKRAKGIAEILSSMRIVKSFSFEPDFLDRLHTVRKNELRGIRTLLLIRSAANAVAFSLPVLAAVLAFVTYSLTGHSLNPANIFTSLTLFNLLRMPLLFLPLALSATTDAMNAFGRLQRVFEAPLVKDTSEREPDSKYGLVLQDASFQWDQVKAEENMGEVKKRSQIIADAKEAKKAAALADSNSPASRLSTAASRLMCRSRKVISGVSTPHLITPKASKAKRVVQTQADATCQRLRDSNEAIVRDAAGGTQALAGLTEEERLHLEEKQQGKVAQDAFVDPDDNASAARHAVDPHRVPRDGQVSGIGAVKSLFSVAASRASSEQHEDADEKVIPKLSAAAPSVADGAKPQEEQKPFALEKVNLVVPKGELVAIVGPVGSGKSSLLEGCIGEMRRQGGRIIWGGNRIGYVPQSAWIQSATVRDNILFGESFEEERYWQVVRIAELESDLEMLAAGDMSEIGEKGVTLSGGQKQRVSLARALYHQAEIYFFDDPLSALDAHVGKAVFHNAILPLRRAGKTVVLVTHALHFLPFCDRIITMEDGRIVETGTYEELSTAKGPFSRLIEEFGGREEEEERKEDDIDDSQGKKRYSRANMTNAEVAKASKAGALMEAEERNTGSVSAHIYAAYFQAGKGWIMVPFCFLSIVLMQTAGIINSYWLIWWQEDQFKQSPGFYMGVYAALGIAQTIATFAMGASTGYLSFYACKTLHQLAISRTMFAPMAWFDVTPAGRIMNRFAKDIDVVDNQLSDSFRMAANTIATIIGSIVLITIITHYFVVIAVTLLVFYFAASAFYRTSAREIKRLDNLLRSSLYSHFAESLSGVSTLRAYQHTTLAMHENLARMDKENRAYFLTISNQRWLGVRLDMLGAVLILLVALLTTTGANRLSPGQVGITLTFVVTSVQAYSWFSRQVAEVENNMSSVERLQHYAENLPQEAAQGSPPNAVSESWPERGSMSIRNVFMRYRPGLPQVLKGISLEVEGGQKIGIVGRTGAGKSSLLTALLRLTELDSGSIVIDGVDISQIGLRDLRRRIAVLPQDPLLFSGTLRSNLDPFQQFDDNRLWDALKRATLVQDEATISSASSGPTLGSDSVALAHQQQNKLTLDSPIDEGGANLSLGQRSLVSLARALVKNCQILLLDEATASADSQTDAKVQKTIREEFASRTLLCIAHRLNTIIGYDRIAVLSDGAVAEFAPPLELFDQCGIFTDMCAKANISRDQIIAARNAP